MEDSKSYKTEKLGDYILDMAAGPFGSNLKVDCFVPEGFPIIDGANLKGFKVTDNVTKFVTEQKAKSLHRSIAKKNDVVVTISGTVGQIAYIPESSQYDEYLVSQRQFRVTFDEKRVYVPYLVYYFHTVEGQHKILSFANQTGVPALAQPLKNFRNIDVCFPDINTQRRIASILESIDNKIELNARINHNLEEQAQALYKSWFVDFEPFKDGEFIDSEMGLIPKGWNVVPFLNAAKLCSGGTPKTDVEEYWDGVIPFFTPKDVKDSAFCLSTEKSITESGLARCNSQLYDTYTTFITARGTVGKICMAGVPMAMNQTNYAVCPNLIIDPVILYLMSRQLILSLKNKANGAVFDAITTRDFESERVIVADKSVLEKFSSMVHSLYERILQNEKENITLASSRDSLLIKLLSGKEGNLTC